MDVAVQRLRNQRLVGPGFRGPREVVEWLTAVQAQDFAGAKWGLGVRLEGWGDVDVEGCFDRGEILRTHVMRPTWHFVAPADIRWLLALTAPRIRRAMGYYDRKLELDEGVFARSNDVIARALEGGRQLTRLELAGVLAGVGIVASGQRLGHLVMRAELDAVVCSGARRGKQFTYALFEERVPAVGAGPLARDEAVATLALRYFRSHGPAMVQDFSWWSGLSIADAKMGLGSVEAQLESVVVGDKVYWHDPGLPKPRFVRPVVHLLPNYDELVIAYKDHSASFDASRRRKRGPLERFLGHHFVAVNGRVGGGFRRLLDDDGVVIETKLFVELDGREEDGLQKAALRLGRFLKTPARIVRR